ncbi:MAG: hydroxyacid dehydrogenase [Candidatus Eisenbacteria bacterium]|nr:hydroxyacid dehydrogenase [Candidatus Eisenbacteria bacterium]
MRITIFEVEKWEQESFAQLEKEHELAMVSGPLTAANAGEHADSQIVSTFIYSQLEGDVLSQLPELKLIATRSTGVDHIDRGYCDEKGILVSNVPDYASHTVAEHVFGLLLTISHRLDEAIDRTRKGDFSQEGLTGFDLRGRTLGVIGTGAIGRHVLQIGKGFEMSLLAHDVQPDEALARELGFGYVSLEELLRKADVVSLHVPGNEQTHHMIGAEQFAQMRRGAVLINTARGSVVDMTAMMRTLAEDHIAGVGLDVLPEEPTVREEAELLRSLFHEEHDLQTLLADHVALRLRNVIVTPHSAFNTREATTCILRTTCENIRAFLDGEPQNLVAPE